MPEQRTVDVIAVDWRGPFSYEEIRLGTYLGALGASYDRGLYQIYGTQLQPDTLLYIGETEGSFSTRIPGQEHWIEWEPDAAKIFLGTLVNLMPSDNYNEILLRAESLLIYFCQPVINIREKRAFYKIQGTKATVLINFNRRYLLPYVVSNLTEQEDIYSAVGGTLGKRIAEDKREDSD
jgi:hypothetical protein